MTKRIFMDCRVGVGDGYIFVRGVGRGAGWCACCLWEWGRCV